MVEEGVGAHLLLLLKFLFPQNTSQHAETSRLAILMVPFSNIESHHKTRASSAHNTIQNSKQHSERKQKSLTFTPKKISALTLTLLNP